jgi:hypothetical protein
MRETVCSMNSPTPLVKIAPRSVGLTFFVSVCLLFWEPSLLLAEAPTQQPPSTGLEMIAANGAGGGSNRVRAKY